MVEKQLSIEQIIKLGRKAKGWRKVEENVYSGIVEELGIEIIAKQIKNIGLYDEGMSHSEAYDSFSLKALKNDDRYGKIDLGNYTEHVQHSKDQAIRQFYNSLKDRAQNARKEFEDDRKAMIQNLIEAAEKMIS